MKSDKKTPTPSTQLPAIARRLPVAPPVYRPQATPKVLQTKAGSGHSRHATSSFRTSPFIRANHNPTVIQRAQDKTTEQKKQEWKLRRMARANVSQIGNPDVDIENQRLAEERLEKTRNSVANLEALKKEPWAQKRINKTSSGYVSTSMPKEAKPHTGPTRPSVWAMRL
jgi:hypothetical protein